VEEAEAIAEVASAEQVGGRFGVGGGHRSDQQAGDRHGPLVVRPTTTNGPRTDDDAISTGAA
jgi:hypothetical protein